MSEVSEDDATLHHRRSTDLWYQESLDQPPNTHRGVTEPGERQNADKEDEVTGGYETRVRGLRTRDPDWDSGNERRLSKSNSRGGRGLSQTRGSEVPWREG